MEVLDVVHGRGQYLYSGYLLLLSCSWYCGSQFLKPNIDLLHTVTFPSVSSHSLGHFGNKAILWRNSGIFLVKSYFSFCHHVTDSFSRISADTWESGDWPRLLWFTTGKLLTIDTKAAEAQSATVTPPPAITRASLGGTPIHRRVSPRVRPCYCFMFCCRTHSESGELEGEVDMEWLQAH